MNELARKLKDKVALVTGAARGLGRAVALRLARLGADVAINDIDLDAAREWNESLAAESVAEECAAHGVRSIGIEADISKQSRAQATVTRVVDELGRLDILCCFAGGQLHPTENGRADALTMNEEDIRFILDVNLMGTIFCCQAAARVMIEQGDGGKIVTTGSTAAYGAGGLVQYGVSKAGVIRFTRTLARETGKYGITVNAIAPAIIGTSRALGQFPERKDWDHKMALGRIGEPEDVAKVVEFLTTDLSDYVTGQVLVVCGGMFYHCS